MLPLFTRRRFPFGAPAAYWLLAAALSFVDGVLIPSIESLFPVGLASAALLGNLRDARQAWTGLAIVLAGITTVVYNIPGHTTAELILIPVDFGIAWAAGFALRMRGEQAEAAEVRATQAERDREAAARVAVAEERARIARELHDIVAHAVSVMVLQVGAVRHKLPDEPGRGPGGAEGRGAGGPHGADRDAPSAGRHAQRGGGRRVRAPARPRRPRLAAGSDRPRRPACRAPRRRRAVPAPSGDRPLGLPHRPGRPDQHAQACSRQRRRRHRPLSAGRAGDRGARQRPGQRDERRPRARARRHPRTRQDLRRRDDRGTGKRRRLRPQHTPSTQQDESR